MSAGNFALIWQSMLRSSVWIKGSKDVRILWVTLLALKDKNGDIATSRVGLADEAKLNEKECEDALSVLMSPDPWDTSGVKDGVRVVEIRGGFHIVNHEFYKFSTAAKRAFWAQQQAEHRARKAAKKTVPRGTKFAAPGTGFVAGEAPPAGGETERQTINGVVVPSLRSEAEKIEAEAAQGSRPAEMTTMLARMTTGAR